MGSRAPILLLLGCIGLSGVVQCGGSGSGTRGGDATAGSGGGTSVAGSAGTTTAGTATQPCETPSADGYQPRWMPPQTHPGACTAQQIADEYTLCVNPATFDEQACKDSRAGAASLLCIDCLYSNLDADASHALLLLGNGSTLANVGGCIALLDGDSSDTGCGALTQAADICTYTACNAACPGPTKSTDWQSCLLTATHTACARFATAAQCEVQTRYTRCAHQAFQDYFKTVADLFCGAGPPDTGAAGAGGAAP